MNCNLEDYSKVLKDMYFFNSPFFDKMRDFNAVYDIFRMAGFRDGEEFENGDIFTGQSMPGSLLRRLALQKPKSGVFEIVHNGETTFNREYALPRSI